MRRFWRGIALAALVSCRPGAGAGASRPTGPHVTSSNVEARDYAGSEACAACHPGVARTFLASPMHSMTRMAATAIVHAPFAGESLYVADDVATLEARPGARFVRIDRKDGRRLLYRLSRVIGGHHREDFVGVRVGSYDETPTIGDGDELVLPVSYLIDKKRLRYKGYSVMVRERDHLEAGPVWNRTCPFCHNTVPLLSTLLGTLAGGRARHYQGEVVDALLPEDRAFRYAVTDGPRLEAAVAREVSRLGGEARTGAVPETLTAAIDTTRRRFTGAKVLEVGIGCESCHGGCREHATDPSALPSLLPRAPYIDVRVGGDGDAGPISAAEVEDHVCARCHQVLFSRYPWTWEGGGRYAMPGGSHVNSGEARDLLLGGCRGALACTACHDPHAADGAARVAALESTRAGSDVCLRCHAALRAKDAWRAHAHHDPDGRGGACMACHMPRKNMSLDGGLTRYHRVGSPTDPARVLGDRPLECALCHADKSVGEIVRTMEAWWSKRYDPDVLSSMYGGLDANPLRATLRRGKPHEKAVALAVLGEARARDAGPLFAAELNDEIPLVRDYAVAALRATFGDACDLHLEHDRATRDSEAAACSQRAGFPVGAAAEHGLAGDPNEPTED